MAYIVLNLEVTDFEPPEDLDIIKSVWQVSNVDDFSNIIDTWEETNDTKLLTSRLISTFPTIYIRVKIIMENGETGWSVIKTCANEPLSIEPPVTPPITTIVNDPTPTINVTVVQDPVVTVNVTTGTYTIDDPNVNAGFVPFN